MRIIITDVNRIWTPDHPALEPYADMVLVVCLNGKKVTDKYQCIVSPYKSIGLGFIPFGLDSVKLQALRSINDCLMKELEFHKDIIFLTDMEAESLYPFIMLKDKNIRSSLHLFSITPWRFESRRRINAVRSMLTDLSALQSVLFLEGEFFVWKAKRTATLPELIHGTQMWCGDLLPDILNQIRDRNWDRAFFDIHTMRYVPLDKGESLTDSSIQPIGIHSIHSSEHDGAMNLDQEICAPYRDRDAFAEVEALTPRIDGKQICKYLRTLRMKLAKANHIPFESMECSFSGPCAGTCQKCDMESEYLQKELKKAATEKRVYPYEELSSWEVF